MEKRKKTAKTRKEKMKENFKIKIIKRIRKENEKKMKKVALEE